jgi:phage-related holin
MNTIKEIINLFVKTFHLTDVLSLLKKVFILIYAFLSPITKVIYTILFLIFVDLVTGLWASKKEKQAITSSALSRTVGKVLIYSTTVILAFIVNKYLLEGFGFPVERVVSGFIAITEMTSIMENMNRISDRPLLNDLILRFSNEREKRLPPKPRPTSKKGRKNKK